MRVRAVGVVAVVVLVLGAALGLVGTPPSAGAAAGFHGSMGATPLVSPVVAMASTHTGFGYWMAAADGGMFAFGDAGFHGSIGGRPLARPVVGMAATSTGDGYWLVGVDGGVFSFGAAPFHGSLGGTGITWPIVAMAARPAADGYWLVAADGRVYAFGSAPDLGSTAGLPLAAPIVGIAATPSGNGYWLVAADGGVFSFGDAAWFGSMGGTRLASPVVAMSATPSGNGYWLVAADGGVFAFGTAAFNGSMGGRVLNRPVTAMAATPSGDGYWLVATDGGVFAFPSDEPGLSVSIAAAGLNLPWDVGFTPDGVMLFTEKSGRLSALVDGSVRRLATMTDVYDVGESGLMGLAVDPEFAANRRVYTCHTNNSPRDVRVVAWQVGPGYASASRVADPLFGGAPVSDSGRHAGCRPRFGPDQYLWVSTGDAAIGTTPQDPRSLGGKVLRVDKMTGAHAADNPFTSRVYAYGFRNPQGLAWRPGTAQMYAIEHGPARDDEVTLLRADGNGGWDPGASYNEGVPMTDLARFPQAMVPSWSSGTPTIAPSGGTFVVGAPWKSWSGMLVIAALRGMQLRALFLDADGRLLDQRVILTGYGRLRSVTQAPDSSLYVTTSNSGGTDRILRVSPT